MRRQPLILAAICCAALLAAGVRSAAAQAHAISDEAKEMQGTWEISNSDRDKICMVTLAAEPAPGGMKLHFDPACAATFAVTKEVRAWRLDKDGLHFVDAKGRVVLDLDEVERGMFEGMRAGEGRYFVQSLAAVHVEAKPEQVFGEWQVSRGTEEQICALTLSKTRLGDGFAVVVKPGCGALVTGFNPTSWHIDGGELVISSARGAWRFEEAGEIAWRRVPEGKDPLWLVRQMNVPPGGGG